MAAAQKRVGSATQQHAGRGRGAHQVFTFGALHRQRFLAPHVLAGSDGGTRHRVVGGRDGEVDHQLDGIVGEQLFGGQRARNPELRGLRPRPLRQQVGARDHVEQPGTPGIP